MTRNEFENIRHSVKTNVENDSYFFSKNLNDDLLMTIMGPLNLLYLLCR